MNVSYMENGNKLVCGSIYNSVRVILHENERICKHNIIGKIAMDMQPQLSSQKKITFGLDALW